MEYSAESVRYLHIAYTIFIVVQLLYVAWLALRWSRVQPVPRDSPLSADRSPRTNG